MKKDIDNTNETKIGVENRDNNQQSLKHKLTKISY